MIRSSLHTSILISVLLTIFVRNVAMSQSSEDTSKLKCISVRVVDPITVLVESKPFFGASRKHCGKCVERRIEEFEKIVGGAVKPKGSFSCGDDSVRVDNKYIREPANIVLEYLNDTTYYKVQIWEECIGEFFECNGELVNWSKQFSKHLRKVSKSFKHERLIKSELEGLGTL